MSASPPSDAADRLARFVEVELRRSTPRRVLEIAWEGSTQLVLETRYELRGIRYHVVPAVRRAVATPKPDPWAIALRDAGSADAPAEVAVALGGEGVHLDCFSCRASGESPCDDCAGTGMTFGGASDGSPSVCAGCRGRGRTRCGECRGSGGMKGEATVWSRVGVHEEIRSIRGRALPADVVAALTLSSQPGDVLHRLEGQILQELVLPVGYRDSAAASETLLETARSLCASPGVDDGARILHQVLEVRRVPVAHLRMDDAVDLWCWGDPPRIWPAAVPTSPWARRLSIGVALACAVAGALFAAGR